LKLAGELNFDQPPTLITNSVTDLLDFYRQHNGNTVSTVAGHSWATTVGADFVRYTEIVSKRDIAYARAVSYCPMIFHTLPLFPNVLLMKPKYILLLSFIQAILAP
jgi:hypothetical protein